MPESTIVSVIVCTYNREKYIGQTLEHLERQQADPAKFEVLVVNNNSQDNSQSIIDQYVARQDHFFSFLELNQGHTYARNRGIREAKGQILSFIDDDAFVDENFVTELIRFFNAYPDASALGGKIVPQYEEAEPAWMSKFLLPLVAALDKGNNVMKFKGNKYPIGANMAFRKEVFETFGEFDVNLGRRGECLEGGDEKDVFARLRKANRPVYYNPKVWVHHIIPPKRTTMTYIKGLANGVGTSEKKRIGSGLGARLGKVYEELIKVGASCLLFFLYLLTGKKAAAFMIIRFRYWVIQGYLSK